MNLGIGTQVYPFGFVPGMYEGKGHCYIAALSGVCGQVSPDSTFLAKGAFIPHASGAQVEVSEED